ncbi:MAG: hypothetical protein SFU91_07885 [Chloroherpetonaceae bacterium]|nr:hypothetical protein [Chloroherpetonaceae bacterium]
MKLICFKELSLSFPLGLQINRGAYTILLLAITLLFFCELASAQDPKFNQNAKDRMKDNFDEADKDVLTLRFNDALNGNPVKDGEVEIKGIGKYTTDFEGKVQFPIPEEDGYYAVSFRKEGYIETDLKIEIVAGTIFFNRISVSPKMNIKQIRVVLDWDAEPRDLDAHFKKRGGYHLSYRNTRTLADGQGQLDRDDMDGYGPETITVAEASLRSVYEYYVHDYTYRTASGSTKLTKSKATVKVYGDGKLLDVIEIPREGTGTVWRVFRIEGGKVVRENRLSERE